MRFVMAVLVALALGGEVVAQAPEKQAEAPKSVEVEKMALGSGVESRELVGEATEFDVSVGRVYCWTKIVSETVPTTVKHVWYVDGVKAAEVALDVKYPSTRTWSNKVIGAGKWRVEVVSEAGDVLASTDFMVKAPSGPSAP